ncbi:MAG: hypothetical protein ACI9VM_000433 [Candidatus Azotimanducaceae bacterium]|jgi:hypothetical protein
MSTGDIPSMDSRDQTSRKIPPYNQHGEAEKIATERGADTADVNMHTSASKVSGVPAPAKKK